jgi:hypothetical protein
MKMTLADKYTTPDVVVDAWGLPGKWSNEFLMIVFLKSLFPHYENYKYYFDPNDFDDAYLGYHAAIKMHAGKFTKEWIMNGMETIYAQQDLVTFNDDDEWYFNRQHIHNNMVDGLVKELYKDRCQWELYEVERYPRTEYVSHTTKQCMISFTNDGFIVYNQQSEIKNTLYHRRLDLSKLSFSQGFQGVFNILDQRNSWVNDDVKEFLHLTDPIYNAIGNDIEAAMEEKKSDGDCDSETSVASVEVVRRFFESVNTDRA